ncbi:ubiquitin-like domain-containing protein [Gottfriedia acidiceleris]|uniref:G5 and 3D domain-containing protein n=1 Tax=Bacillaceae TaxID=186817 RepID=UPI00114505BD|nr:MULTISPECIES: G5 and 3D domain-containing protein [unclassified Bacillus (in: firmicutes)]
MIDANRLLSRLGSSKKLAVQLAGALVFTGSVGTGAYEGLKEQVTLEVDGKEQVIQTHANTVAELLKEQNINITNADEIYPSAKTKISDDMDITVHLAKPVKLTIDGQEKVIQTTAQTVKELLKEQNIKINPDDVIMPALSTPLEENGKVSYEKAFPMVLNDGGVSKKVFATSTTVADFLEKQNITLNEFDRVEPGAGEMIKQNDTVRVIRVEKVNDVVEEPVDFKEKEQKDSSMYKDESSVISEGVKGLVKRNFELIKENGKVVSKTLVDETILKEPVDRVVAVGTKSVPKSSALVKSSAPKSSSKVKEMYVEATAYSPYDAGMSGVTALGINVRKNPNTKLIAVDPKVIPLGSKVWVEGYGVAIAGDTGGAIKGRRIDILMPTKDDCFDFGRRTVKIRIIS